MKLGILGAGMIVREFLPWLTGPESPFKVEALCSTERSAGAAQALCDQYGVPRHTTSYDELLSWVDVVYIAVPNILHVKYTRAALEAGRHVIVEKPMAPTAALAEELAELARSKKLFLFEAVTTQYQDNYAKLREVLPKVGAVTMVQCNFSQYSSRYHDFCAGKVWPSFDPACAGGALMDLNLYNVHFVVGLFGEPMLVSYHPNLYRNGIDTSGILLLEYPDFLCQCTGAKDCAAPGSVQLIGDAGRILIEPGSSNCQKLHLVRPGQEDICSEYSESPWFYEVAEIAMILALKDYDACYAALKKTRQVVTVLEAAREDAQLGF